MKVRGSVHVLEADHRLQCVDDRHCALQWQRIAANAAVIYKRVLRACAARACIGKAVCVGARVLEHVCAGQFDIYRSNRGDINFTISCHLSVCDGVHLVSIGTAVATPRGPAAGCMLVAIDRLARAPARAGHLRLLGVWPIAAASCNGAPILRNCDINHAHRLRVLVCSVCLLLHRTRAVDSCVIVRERSLNRNFRRLVQHARGTSVIRYVHVAVRGGAKAIRITTCVFDGERVVCRRCYHKVYSASRNDGAINLAIMDVGAGSTAVNVSIGTRFELGHHAAVYVEKRRHSGSGACSRVFRRGSRWYRGWHRGWHRGWARL